MGIILSLSLECTPIIICSLEQCYYQLTPDKLIAGGFGNVCM